MDNVTSENLSVITVVFVAVDDAVVVHVDDDAADSDADDVDVT